MSDRDKEQQAHENRARVQLSTTNDHQQETRLHTAQALCMRPGRRVVNFVGRVLCLQLAKHEQARAQRGIGGE